MKKQLLLPLFLLCIQSLFAQSDAARAAWDKAKDLCNNSEYVQAKPYLLEVYKEMPRPLCCHWLGMAYDIEANRDSAIFYYQKSIENSPADKPQLAALDYMIRAYLRKMDFEKAYSLAWDAMQKYPGNETFIEEFKEVCKWSYFIKHLGFHKDYLTNTHLHKEYKIKTITEQELIIKNVRDNKGEHLNVGNRQYKGHFEIWKCRFNGSKEDVEITFHLHDKDLDKQIEHQHEKAKHVYNDVAEPIHIRLGALMALTPLDDKQLQDLLASDNEAVRLCACSEVLSSTGAKVKKTCQNDASEMIKKMCAVLPVFQK